MDDPSYKSIKFGDSSVIFKTIFVRFIRHSEGAVIVVVVARYIYISIYIPRVYVE